MADVGGLIVEGVEQGFDLASDGVVGAVLVEVGRAFIGAEFDGAVEEALDLLVAFG